jgi:2-polyprenyl-3-methyl-5-hydroxy-6-metoxy-1,4-benzoquinol methylase
VSHNQKTSNVEKYERAGGVEGRLLDGFRRRLLREVAALGPSTVLDAGCGEGIVAGWLAAELPGVAVHGVDARPEGVEEFRRRNPGMPVSVGDLYALDFADGEFDLVLSTEVLEHLERPRDAVKEMARVAGAHLLITVPHEPFFRAGNLARGRYVPRLGSTPGHMNTWGRRGFTGMVSGRAEVLRWWSAFPWQGVSARPR